MSEKRDWNWGALLVSTKERRSGARLKRALGFRGSFCEVYERAVAGRAAPDMGGVARNFLLFYSDIVNATVSNAALYLYTRDTIYEIRGGQDREKALREILYRIGEGDRAEDRAE